MPPFLRHLLLLLAFVASPSLAQTYTSVLVFGDSLSDTGNVAHLTQSQFIVRVPGPLFGYTDGSFTDGIDTSPAASLYTGVWIKQLAATFPAHPPVIASLDGGTNYAFGYARTGTGTSPLALNSNVSVNVDNIGQQVTDYLTIHAAIPANTLVVVWGGANDLLSIADPTQAQAQATIATAVAGEVTAIQRLIAAGATDILIANLPPLGATPRLNSNPTLAAQGTAAAQASTPPSPPPSRSSTPPPPPSSSVRSISSPSSKPPSPTPPPPASPTSPSSHRAPPSIPIPTSSGTTSIPPPPSITSSRPPPRLFSPRPSPSPPAPASAALQVSPVSTSTHPSLPRLRPPPAPPLQVAPSPSLTAPPPSALPTLPLPQPSPAQLLFPRLHLPSARTPSPPYTPVPPASPALCLFRSP